MDVNEKKDRIIEAMLKYAEKTSNESKRSSDWYLYHSVEQLYKMILSCNQLDEIKEPTKCVRVVRLNRLVPKYIMNYISTLADESTGLYMKTYCGGCYLGVPCVIIPKDIVENKCKKQIGKVKGSYHLN